MLLMNIAEVFQYNCLKRVKRPEKKKLLIPVGQNKETSVMVLTQPKKKGLTGPGSAEELPISGPLSGKGGKIRQCVEEGRRITLIRI